MRMIEAGMIYWGTTGTTLAVLESVDGDNFGHVSTSAAKQSDRSSPALNVNISAVRMFI